MPTTPTRILISKQTLSSSVPSVSFSSLPQDYTHLELEAYARCTAADSRKNIYLRFNDDTLDKYSRTLMEGGGWGSGGARYNAQSSGGFLWADAQNSPEFWSINRTFIINYKSPNILKTYTTTYHNSYTTHVGVNMYQSTDPIFKITLFAETGNIESGSSFRLYGIVG